MRFLFYLFMLWCFFLSACLKQGEYTEEEMESIATQEFEDFLFELAIDPRYFEGPHKEERNNGRAIAFIWLSTTLDGKEIGLESVIYRNPSVESEGGLIGDLDYWDPYIGSKHKNERAGRLVPR